MQADLRLGVHGLADAEAGLVRALVQFLARNVEGFGWSFAREGPHDALIVDGRQADLTTPDMPAGARAWASLGPPSSAAWPGAVLARPLDMHRLQAWLTEVRDMLTETGTMPVPLEALPARQLPAETRRYRLRRWPPAQLLHGDRNRVRLSALLSRRPLTLAELMTISGQAEERCRTFLQLLQGFQLLEPESPLSSAPRHPAAPRVQRGLIHRLRARLGL